METGAIFHTATDGGYSQAIELGWNTIKLYFMVGHPTETDEDLCGIAEITKNIREITFIPL